MNIGNKLQVAKNVATSKAGVSLLQVSKRSPAILFGAGVVGFGLTVVMASKATLKFDKLKNEHEQNQNDLHDVNELSRLPHTDLDYNPKQYEKDQAALKTGLVKDAVLLYAPVVGVGILSIGALTGSHVVLNRRYTSALAAYSAIDKSFKEYRGRVVDQYGKEVDKELVNGAEYREIVTETENGPVVSNELESLGKSPYAKLFSKETTQEWSQQADYNLYYLRAQQQMANDMLELKGFVFLNEIYKSLGLEETSAGQLVGWVKNNKRDGTDGFITFGIFDNADRFNAFMAGREDAIWLDFNVDGVVYDLI